MPIAIPTLKGRKLTHRERHEAYRRLLAGADLSKEFSEQMLSSLVREFWTPPKESKADAGPVTVLRGRRGCYWYCEAGCGKIICTKQENEVWLARNPGKSYVCKECLEKRVEQDKARTVEAKQ